MPSSFSEQAEIKTKKNKYNFLIDPDDPACLTSKKPETKLSLLGFGQTRYQFPAPYLIKMMKHGRVRAWRNKLFFSN